MAAPHGALARDVARAIEETKKAIGGLGKIEMPTADDALPTYQPPEYARRVGYNPGSADRFDFATAPLGSLDLAQLILFLNANIKTLVYAAEQRGLSFEAFIRELEAAFRARLLGSRR